jgi:uncharacterized protein (DUF779 family)
MRLGTASDRWECFFGNPYGDLLHHNSTVCCDGDACVRICNVYAMYDKVL